MSFEPDTAKQAQGVILSRKLRKIDHQTIYFYDALVTKTNSRKHLGMYLDEKLNCLQNIKERTLRANKGVGVLRKLKHIFSRHSLITI